MGFVCGVTARTPLPAHQIKNAAVRPATIVVSAKLFPENGRGQKIVSRKSVLLQEAYTTLAQKSPSRTLKHYCPYSGHRFSLFLVNAHPLSFEWYPSTTKHSPFFSCFVYDVDTPCLDTTQTRLPVPSHTAPHSHAHERYSTSLRYTIRRLAVVVGSLKQAPSSQCYFVGIGDVGRYAPSPPVSTPTPSHHHHCADNFWQFAT